MGSQIEMCTPLYPNLKKCLKLDFIVIWGGHAVYTDTVCRKNHRVDVLYIAYGLTCPSLIA